MARGGLQMTLLTDLVTALASGEHRVVDLTQPLSERTPVLQLPEPFANTPGSEPDRDQPLRRPRPRMGMGHAADRRARRHPLRRADPLDHRPRRRGRRQRPARAAGRPGGRDRQVRRGGGGPRLPAHGRTISPKPTPRERLGAAAHGLGRARHRPGRRSSTAATRPARTSNAPACSPNPRSPASASRPSAPTPASPTASTRRSRSTTSCSARASTGSPSSPTSPSCRRRER